MIGAAKMMFKKAASSGPTAGALFAWGYNLYGQSDNGDTTDRSSPVQIGAATDWFTVAAGNYQSLAARS